MLFRSRAYIVAEMDGSVLATKIAKYRMVPYFARKSIELPENLDEIIDLSKKVLDKIEEEGDVEDLYRRKATDYSFDGVTLRGEHDENVDSDSENETQEERPEDIDEDDLERAEGRVLRSGRGV